MIKRKYLYGAAILLFLTSFIGMLIYGYKTFYIEKELAASEEYRYHFALIAEETDNEYWRLIEEGARKEAAKQNVYLEYVAPQRADNDELLKLFDRMIAAKVDGIIVQGIEGRRFVDLVHKATERRIPVVTVDTDVKSSERKAYVGTDNHHAGELAGKSILENTEGEQFVGIVTGRFDAINQQERIAGLKHILEGNPRIQIVGVKESGITEIGATQATYSLLKEYPQITALVGTSALDGIGMVEGLEEIAPDKDVYITAFDLIPETLDAIEEGKIQATIAQFPEEMGKESVTSLLRLQEKDLLENLIYTETGIIDKDNLPALREGQP